MTPKGEPGAERADVAVETALALRSEAEAVDERRLLVLSGDRERGYDALERILDELPVPICATTLVGPEDRLRCPQVAVPNAGQLLGTTREVVIVDAHEALRPTAVGSVVGAVDGGGLLVLLAPDLEAWPERRDGFDDSLAVPPFAVDDVAGRFRSRFVATLRDHPGVGIVDVDARVVRRDGLTDPAPRLVGPDADRQPAGPPSASFPAETYAACLTADQVDAVAAFEELVPASIDSDDARRETTGDDARRETTSDTTPRTVVLESDRGRGKSSAAGLAAGALAAQGLDVLVTAPTVQNAAELFDRARELLTTLQGADAGAEPGATDHETDPTDHPEWTVVSETGGRVRYREPTAVADGAVAADVLLVDEAAALPVSILEATLAVDRVAYATTVHGYEGSGRGFSVRFRERLASAAHEVTEVSLAEPIRYAAGDPVETWAFRALLLDARPAVDQVVDGATPETVSYHRPDGDALLADEHRLREVFGLLVTAHYRTEPDDLARLLDAPNLELRTLEVDGHVVSVALLAREGGLDAETRAKMYDGARIRGHMLPDVLTSQLRDEAAAEPVGYRVVRIATHHAVRSRGLGSHLLERVRADLADDVDWLGTGFGATPDLLAFWRASGYGSVHCSTTRNDRSGEHSAIMLAPTSEAGRDLRERHAEWFARRLPTVLSDSLSDLDVDVARALCRSVPADAAPPLALSDHEWRVVAGAAYGPGLFDVDPGPFRPLLVRYFVDQPAGDDSGDGADGGGPDSGRSASAQSDAEEPSGERPGRLLSAREERLLVARGLQGRPWAAVADALDYHSTGQCMRAFGDALCPVVDRYGADAGVDVVREERERFVDDE